MDHDPNNLTLQSCIVVSSKENLIKNFKLYSIYFWGGVKTIVSQNIFIVSNYVYLNLILTLECSILWDGLIVNALVRFFGFPIMGLSSIFKNISVNF